MNSIYLNLTVVAVSVFLGYKTTQLHYSAKIAVMQAEALTERLNAVNQATTKHNKQLTEMERLQNETQAKLSEANTNSADNVTVNARLQQSYSASLQSTCDRKKTGVDTSRATAATNRIVQAELFESVTKSAIEYARIADENRLRGLACQEQYGIYNE